MQGHVIKRSSPRLIARHFFVSSFRQSRAGPQTAKMPADRTYFQHARSVGDQVDCVREILVAAPWSKAVRTGSTAHRVATRFEKAARNDLAVMTRAVIVLWLRSVSAPRARTLPIQRESHGISANAA